MKSRITIVVFAVVSLLVVSSTRAGGLISCPSTLSTPTAPRYSEAAREAGVEFLMIRVSAKEFSEMRAHSQHTQSADILATAVGAQQALDPRLRFNFAMRPLKTSDSGKWAHQLISNGSDMIAGGVRYKQLGDWRIGLIFPIDILDKYSFTVTSRRKVSERRNAIGTGRGGVLFSSSNDWTLSNHEAVFRELGASSESFNYSDDFQFHFDEPVSLNDIAMVWIPAPLAATMGNDRLPGARRILSPDSDFSVRTSSLNSDGSYTPVAPPSLSEADYTTWFDPSLNVGTWYNVIPDWKRVRKELNQQQKSSK